MTGTELLAISIVGGVLLFAGTLAWVMRADSAVTRSIARIPAASLDKLAPGSRVRVVGIARSKGEHVTTSHGSKQCLAYRAEVLAVSGSSNGAGIDSSVYLCTTFAVEGESGTVEVASGRDVIVDAETNVVADESGGVGFGSSIIQRESKALGGAGRPTYSEGTIEPGMRVAVVGTVQPLADGTMRLVGTPQHPLLISNRPKALVS